MKYNPIQTNTMPLSQKMKNFIWILVNKTLFRYTPSHLSLFRKFRVALLKLFGSDIDWTVSIHPSAKIEYPWNLSMRHLSSIGEHCWVYSMDKIFIGKKSCIGKDTYLITGSHNISSPNFNLVTKPISIGNYCWLTTGVTVLPGVSIGDGCVIAVKSVVVNQVAPWTVVGGNPAKFIKKRELEDA